MTLQQNWFLTDDAQTKNFNLFCFHHAGGAASFCSRWAKALPSVNVIRVQLPGREERFTESFITNIDNVVDQLMTFRSCFADKPFLLFGHSLGALIAFELAHALASVGDKLPRALIVSGQCAPEYNATQEALCHLGDAEFIQRLDRKYGGIEQEILLSEEFMQLLLPRLRADMALSESYAYQRRTPLPLPIQVINGTEDQSVIAEGAAQWSQESTLPVTFHTMPGGHFYLDTQRDAFLKKLASLIAEDCGAIVTETTTDFI